MRTRAAAVADNVFSMSLLLDVGITPSPANARPAEMFLKVTLEITREY
jgi:hypothetical protein